jgi:hypothetical protein
MCRPKNAPNADVPLICYCFARAASIAAMSIFRIVIIALIARLACSRAGSELTASCRLALDGYCDLLESQPENIVQRKTARSSGERACGTQSPGAGLRFPRFQQSGLEMKSPATAYLPDALEESPPFFQTLCRESG